VSELVRVDDNPDPDDLPFGELEREHSRRAGGRVGTHARVAVHAHRPAARLSRPLACDGDQEARDPFRPVQRLQRRRDLTRKACSGVSSRMSKRMPRPESNQRTRFRKLRV
jgi:hypothetical protein